MSIFCKHKWKIERHEIPTPLESMRKVSSQGQMSLPYWLFIKKVITDLICEKCGKHKHYVDGGLD